MKTPRGLEETGAGKTREPLGTVSQAWLVGRTHGAGISGTPPPRTLCPQPPDTGPPGPVRGSQGVTHSPGGHTGSKDGVITGHRVLPPAPPRPARTFRVRSESDSSELSCTSISGGWYLWDGVGSGVNPGKVQTGG